MIGLAKVYNLSLLNTGIAKKIRIFIVVHSLSKTSNWSLKKLWSINLVLKRVVTSIYTLKEL